MNYEDYKCLLWSRLATEAKKICPELKPGKWQGTGVAKAHILPLDDDRNTRRNRAVTIEKHLGFDVGSALRNLTGLHQFAHHLSSSQLLCMMFFVPLKENPIKLQEFIFQAFGIKLSPRAKCSFEYRQQNDPRYIFNVEGKKEYEGTSFDFHIGDGDTELFFEVKLTENGFGKAKSDKRHIEKACQYIKLLPSAVSQTIDVDGLLKYYQLYRNITRANKPDRYVIFITDANNPATNADLRNIKLSDNVIHKTWQELSTVYPLGLPFQFNALWDENSSPL